MRSLALLVLPVISACQDQANDTSSSQFGFEIASAETWRDIQSLVCKPTRVDTCGPEGCEPGTPKIEVRWEPNGAYQRCDAKGCDSYSPTVTYSGIWTKISLADSASLTKIASDGSYLEIATLNDVALVYRGRCDRVRVAR